MAPVSTAAVTGVGWMKPYRGPPFAKLLLCCIAKVTPGCEMALAAFTLEVNLSCIVGLEMKVVPALWEGIKGG